MDITKQMQSDKILDILSSEELMNIFGGSMNPTAADDFKAIAAKFISDSWNTFCSNFNQGYKDHIK